MVAKRILAGIAIIATVAFGILFLFGCQDAANGSGKEESLTEALEKNGYEGSIEDWIDSLADEQKAAIDIAYESSPEFENQLPKEEWVSEKVRIRYDNDGDVIAVLPDGGDFFVPIEEIRKPSMNEGEPEGSAGENDVQPDAETREEGSSNSTSDASKKDPEEASSEVSLDNENGNMVLVADNAKAHPGDTDVVVPVRIEHNPGILGMTFSISYDESAMTLKSAENGSAFKDALSLTHSQSLETGCLFTWDGIEAPVNEAQDGTILVLHFDVSKRATPGIYPVAIRGDEPAFNGDLKEVSFSVQDGNVIVE